MAQDCYTLFKTTFNRGIADGLATAVATAAAQSAMDDCLKKQATVTPTVTPIVSVSGNNQSDPSPTDDGNNRGGQLGNLRNQPNRKG